MLIKKAKEKFNTEEEKSIILPIELDSMNILKNSEEINGNIESFYTRIVKEDINEEADLKADSLKRASSNLSKASKILYGIKEEITGRTSDKKIHKNKNILTAPTNASIDVKEKEMKHFARGLNLYKLLLICFIGSFFGVVIETIWCLIRNGYIESRAGLIYGPFNLLYGIGATALSVCLYKYRNRGQWLSFLGGMLVGSVVEYVCSFGQELIFGSRSWDYSAMPFNLNGRICLLYSIFWGMLGVLWIKNLYPRMARLILKIPNSFGKTLTWLTVLFMTVNVAVSGISLYRWSERVEGVKPQNEFWQQIDNHFPDERMEKVYANMEFSK